jgi:hypothetical protein
MGPQVATGACGHQQQQEFSENKCCDTKLPLGNTLYKAGKANKNLPQKYKISKSKQLVPKKRKLAELEDLKAHRVKGRARRLQSQAYNIDRM